jgi:hypothetical protein
MRREDDPNEQSAWTYHPLVADADPAPSWALLDHMPPVVSPPVLGVPGIDVTQEHARLSNLAYMPVKRTHHHCPPFPVGRDGGTPWCTFHLCSMGHGDCGCPARGAFHMGRVACTCHIQFRAHCVGFQACKACQGMPRHAVPGYSVIQKLLVGVIFVGQLRRDGRVVVVRAA